MQDLGPQAIFCFSENAQSAPKLCVKGGHQIKRFQAGCPWFSHKSEMDFPLLVHSMVSGVTLDLFSSRFSQDALKSPQIEFLLDISHASHPWEPVQGSCPLAVLQWCSWNNHARDAAGQSPSVPEALMDPGHWWGNKPRYRDHHCRGCWQSLPIASTVQPRSVISFLPALSLWHPWLLPHGVKPNCRSCWGGHYFCLSCDNGNCMAFGALQALLQHQHHLWQVLIKIWQEDSFQTPLKFDQVPLLCISLQVLKVGWPVVILFWKGDPVLLSVCLATGSIRQPQKEVCLSHLSAHTMELDAQNIFFSSHSYTFWFFPSPDWKWWLFFLPTI